MKNDSTATFLNFLLAALVLACVGLAVLNMFRTHQVGVLQSQLIADQNFNQHVQAIAQDVINYNATAKSPELSQILQTAMAPQQHQQPAK
jgi:hypothetical protein